MGLHGVTVIFMSSAQDVTAWEYKTHIKNPALHCHEVQKISPQGTKRHLLKDENQIPQSVTPNRINCFPWSQWAQNRDCKHMAKATFSEFKGILISSFIQKTV